MEMDVDSDYLTDRNKISLIAGGKEERKTKKMYLRKGSCVSLL